MKYLIVAVALLGLSGCAMLKPIIGGAGGAALGFGVGGPPGAVIGAGLGSGGGAWWEQSDRQEKENEELRRKLDAREALLTQYEIDRKANEAIAKHNATLPAGEEKVPPITTKPIGSGEPAKDGTVDFWQETPAQSFVRWFKGLW
jgi:hypothetical protein